MEEFEEEGGEDRDRPSEVQWNSLWNSFTSTGQGFHRPRFQLHRPRGRMADGEPQTGRLHDGQMKKPLLMRMAPAGWFRWLKCKRELIGLMR